MKTENLKKKLTAKAETKPAPSGGLSTGSTLLNLALSGKKDWGFAKGTYVLLVGDSASGKTFLALTALAEASINPQFDNYLFYYDAPERGARMEFEKYFGLKVAADMKQMASHTVEDFYFSLDDCMGTGKPFIYILDSMDSLTTEDEIDKFQERKKAHEKGKDVSGSYGTSKAKDNSANLRVAVNSLEATGSILIIIAQTRDNIGFGSQFNPKTRSGGKALRFYAHSECWFSIRESIKKTVRDKPRKIGSVLQVAIKKNRGTGREPTVELHHYPDFGFDDTGSCVQWLIDEGTWKKAEKGGMIDAGDFGKGRFEDLVQKIEGDGRTEDLKSVVADTWDQIEEACEVKRIKRYQ